MERKGGIGITTRSREKKKTKEIKTRVQELVQELNAQKKNKATDTHQLHAEK